MDVTVLAKSLTFFLSPFLPYLLKAGEKAAEDVGSQLGTDAWKKAKALWSKLYPKMTERPAAIEAAQDVVKTPDDEDAIASLRQQIKKLLSSDELLATEIAQLMQKETQEAGSTNINQRAGDNAVQFGLINQAGDINIR